MGARFHADTTAATIEAVVMASVPANPQILHITHVDNLAGIIQSDGLVSDAMRRTGSAQCSQLVGLSDIKQDRLAKAVTCHPGTHVGDYVPFNFCPRSVMLYILHMGNHPGLTYKGGQRPIVHLQADMFEVVRWADDNNVLWAFTDRNARDRTAYYGRAVADLSRVNWAAVQSHDFRGPVVKEEKQAEFLVKDRVPWTLVHTIGVIDDGIKKEVERLLVNVTHKLVVSVKRSWYY
ncbi:MAG TPA: DUF4433 domain-containing protein [Planctomycetota bacterium]|nr:DUF4433 domain-containing protein [Planctomycetota bacterium]